MEQCWWSSGTETVEQCRWNSEVEQCWWRSVVEQRNSFGRTVEQCWLNSVVEQWNSDVEQWNSVGGTVWCNSGTVLVE